MASPSTANVERFISFRIHPRQLSNIPQLLKLIHCIVKYWMTIKQRHSCYQCYIYTKLVKIKIPIRAFCINHLHHNRTPQNRNPSWKAYVSSQFYS